MISSTRNPSPVNVESGPPQAAVPADRLACELVSRLSQSLREEGIAYCHWKSNNALDRSVRGENDLDLLVAPADAPRFAAILGRLGFRRAVAPPERQLPGVEDFFGYEPRADRLIHVHAHYQLVLGHDLTKNIRLPIERQYLESAVQGKWFPVPAPEYEYLVFVIRMALKHLTWDAVLWREGVLKAKERAELAALEAQIDDDRVAEALKRDLPYLDPAVFHECADSLQPGASLRRRIRAGRRLSAGLGADGRLPAPVEAWLKWWRRIVLAIRRRLFGVSSKYSLATGGAVVAIMGGDGAGKSTAIDALYSWLSKDLRTAKIHMGKPAWSWTTKFVRSILKTGNWLGLYPVEASFEKTLLQKSAVSPAYPWLLREVCRARDRYRTYAKARRLAAQGGLVILDRFPHALVHLMDGPQTERFLARLSDSPERGQWIRTQPTSRLARALVPLEESYYRRIAPPELLIVLRVDPEIAVRRKTGEDSASVRQRCGEIWEADWESTRAHVIDASLPPAEVLSQIKSLLWLRP
ncbi:MAG: nucleotidyltransferase family protein [Pirellulales bacterium]|nr:nucleotidyltransferase family protein [Pirellulales bacterium]